MIKLERGERPKELTDGSCPVQELLDALKTKLLAKKYKADYKRRYGNE